MLAKVVLQNLQVYWCTLAKLPSAINQRIKQLTANFLWRGERSPIGFHLSSWNFIAKPKAMGGWGLRDVELFNKYLAAKYLWRVLFHQGVWSRLMRKKYMKGVKVTKWLRKEMEGYSIASLLWRNLITASPIIKGWLAWEVGSGNQIHVGMDPFIGGGSFYKLSDPLLYRLHQTGHYTLAHVKRSYGRKWLTAEDIHLQNREAEEWSGFVAGLEQNAISLKDSSDRIVWSWNARDRMVIVKEAYSTLMAQEESRVQSWWYTQIWKVKAPCKLICFMWLCLRNKTLTGDNYRRRGGIGPSVCLLCLHYEETIQHIFVTCEETQEIWRCVCNLFKLECTWNNPSLEVNMKRWFLSKPKATPVPFMVLWGIWLHRNNVIFKGIRQQPGEIIKKIHKVI